MDHFVWLLKVQLLLYVIPSNAEGVIKTENGFLVSFLEKFIKPFLRATQQSTVEVKSTVGIVPDTKIIKDIKQRVKELKPLLEDNKTEEFDDKVTLTGNEDTTIIEFLPESYRRSQNLSAAMGNNDTFKSSINKYKLLREQIKKKLDEELVSKETKTLIINTLDDMIAQMIESQCTWNNHVLRRQIQRSNTSQSLSKVKSMSKKQWKQLRQQYIEYLTNRNKQENLFMQQFHQFFSQVINETSNLTERYKIKCHLVKLKGNEMIPKQMLREGQGENKCPSFKLCSEELSEFLIDFYLHLNDTVISTFKNYGSMYIRDFGVDSKTVLSTMNKFSNYANDKVAKIYENEIKNYEPAEDKDKIDNIRRITNFMKTTVNEVKADIKTYLVKVLGLQKTKLFLTIKEDLSVNIEVDLSNFENYYIDNLCSKFLLCNGKFSRRHADEWTFLPKANDEIYVKVQLKLDDKIKKAVAKSGMFNLLNSNNKINYKFKPDLNLRQSNSKLNITRTMPTQAQDDMYKPTTKHGKKHKHTSTILYGTYLNPDIENNTILEN